MVLTNWISRLVPPSAKDRYITSLEERIAFYEQLFRDVTNSHLQGLQMPGVGHIEPKELPKLKARLLPSQRKNIYEAQDRKNFSQPGEKDNHAATQN